MKITIIFGLQTVALVLLALVCVGVSCLRDKEDARLTTMMGTILGIAVLWLLVTIGLMMADVVMR